ncbi:MAG: tetratricopeptide repeat protein [Pseudobdellovibrionaceae bacterium]
MKSANYALVGFLFLGTACETFMTRADVKEVEQKRQMQDQVVNLQKTTADTNNRFADIESDLRSLNGKIEVLENKLSQSGQDREKLRAANDQSQADSTKKIQILQEEIARMQEQIGTLSAELNAMKTAAASHESASSSGGKKDLFDIAEDLFEKKEWRKAILNYQKFRDANPKSKHFAEATYKIGVCFQELGMKDEAKTFYDEVISKNPNSADAKKAKTRLKTLKK